jgi:electron transport complex protein RnfB
MSLITIALICLASIGALAAIILYFAAQKFKVEEDPRIDQVDEVLPAANCGGCGFPGCRAFAEALVKADEFGDLNCPVGGAETMSKAAEILGKTAEQTAPKVAVLKCSGSCDKRPKTNQYDGAASCAVVASLYGGETGCSFGCLGLGDCEVACDFDALYIDPETLLPVVDDEKCVACNACVKACPKLIFELRKKGPKSRRIYVSCNNKDKGGIARKACKVACIGCGKCVKECPFEAITLENNLAYIDDIKCRLCRKCVAVCPTNSILELNFPPKKVKVTETKEAIAKPECNEEKKSE